MLYSPTRRARVYEPEAEPEAVGGIGAYPPACKPMAYYPTGWKRPRREGGMKSNADDRSEAPYPLGLESFTFNLIPYTFLYAVRRTPKAERHFCPSLNKIYTSA